VRLAGAASSAKRRQHPSPEPDPLRSAGLRQPGIAKTSCRADLEHPTHRAAISRIEPDGAAGKAGLVHHQRWIRVEQVLDAEGERHVVGEPRIDGVAGIEAKCQVEGRVRVDLRIGRTCPHRQLRGIDLICVAEIDEAVGEQSSETEISFPANLSPCLEGQREAELVHLLNQRRSGERGDFPAKRVGRDRTQVPAPDVRVEGIRDIEIDAPADGVAGVDPAPARQRKHIGRRGRRTEEASGLAPGVVAGDHRIIERLRGDALPEHRSACRVAGVDGREIAEERDRVITREIGEERRVVDDLRIVDLLIDRRHGAHVEGRRRDLPFVA
jgi:hypothetical protein